MVIHIRNLSSAFNPSKLVHTTVSSEHTCATTAQVYLLYKKNQTKTKKNKKNSEQG